MFRTLITWKIDAILESNLFGVTNAINTLWTANVGQNYCDKDCDNIDRPHCNYNFDICIWVCKSRSNSRSFWGTYTIYISCLPCQATNLTLLLFDPNSMRFTNNRGRWCCIWYFEFWICSSVFTEQLIFFKSYNKLINAYHN